MGCAWAVPTVRSYRARSPSGTQALQYNVPSLQYIIKKTLKANFNAYLLEHVVNGITF